MQSLISRSYRVCRSVLTFVWMAVPAAHAAIADDHVSYQQVAPVFSKFCAGCHNDLDREGDFSLSSLAALRAGTPEGKVIVPGKVAESKMLKLLTSHDDSRMPPEDNPAPSAAEIELIRRWIEQGAQGEEASPVLATKLHVPKLTPAEANRQHIGAACAIGSAMALGKLGRVELWDLDTEKVVWATGGMPGKVNSLRAGPAGDYLVVGTGIAGIGGEIVLIDARSGEITQRFSGHTDAVYCAAISPDGKWLASGSYDRMVILWNVASGEQVLELTGHNGAIYDLDFDPTGQMLATASADQTVKLWNVNNGERLDTLGQPEGEMFCVRFSSDGKSVFAGGADRQIRKWQVVSRDQPAINPMLIARFAHESDVLHLQAVGSDWLVSASDDGTAKLWNVAQLEPLGEVAALTDTPVALCVFHEEHIAGRIVELTGGQHAFTRKTIEGLATKSSVSKSTGEVLVTRRESLPNQGPELQPTLTEVEPNDQYSQALRVDLPAVVSGIISPIQPTATQAIGPEDIDLYQFACEAGEQWLFEVNAASQKSDLDSRIDILDEHGQSVLRTRMQALRESYFTFRGKDGDTSDDFRMHKWEDMELDEFLYSNGEITRLWLYPRGPDSGFKVYPGAGNRYAFYDTTPVSHALGAPTYIVRELSPAEEARPNGLPVFPIYFENDDDGLRRAGKDSRLSFTAPRSGVYFLRVRDARGFGGENYHYQLGIRKLRPDFSVSISGNKMAMPVGSGREWKATATRVDGMSGPISISLEGIPDGLIATNPLIIEAEQLSALGTVFAEAKPEAAAPPDAAGSDSSNKDVPLSFKITLTARCEFEGREIVHELKERIEVSFNDEQEVQMKLYRTSPVGVVSRSTELSELSIRPGETISARVVVQRNGTDSRISFGKEDSGRNLPHGAFVDNIGLSGLLIPEGQTEREFFITAAPKLVPGRRQFHLQSETKGNPTSRPLWLNVLPAQKP